MIRKVVSSRKSKTHHRQWKTTHIQFGSVWLWFSRCFVNTILKYARNIIFLHLKFLKANLRGRKGGTFMVSPGRHLASLRHCKQVHLRISLGSKNLYSELAHSLIDEWKYCIINL